MMAHRNNDTSVYRRVLRRLPFLVVTALCVILDQLTKLWAVRDLKPIIDYPLIRGVFHLTYVENRGAAFGMFADARWLFMVTSTVAVVALAGMILLMRRIHGLGLVAMAMLCGGGIGNMIDRVANGFVVDFFNFELIHFAVFNVADVFVCVGVGLLCLDLILFEFRDSGDGQKQKTSDCEKPSEGRTDV